ncbi:MAG: nucleoside deaminase [Chloroflexi bacterium]|nr:nucleoside deaminase [Chloroflexota bacterium]
MWSSLPLPWQLCLEEAWAAYCAGCVPIGAVVAGPDGSILSRGRNHIYDDEGLIHRHELAHAELNALLKFDRNGANAHQCALYTSMEPCPLCMGAFYMSGIRRLHYAARDPLAGSVNLLGTTRYLSRKPIRAFGPEDPDLEDLSIALVAEFIYHEGGEERADALLDIWAAVLPRGVALGRHLWRSGLLLRLCDSHLPAAELPNHLLPLLP